MLKELQNCKDVHDLAAILKIPAKILTFLLYTLPDQDKYTSFCISKKNGGTRQILAPEDRLKSLQRRLLSVLQLVDEEIQNTYPRGSSHGCEKNRTIQTNANQHAGRRWVFNCDIQDFFPSINFGRVISYFKKNKNLNLDPKIATFIAQICCHDNALPQGAPTSPMVANLICSSLDYRLAKFAGQHRCSYSRYVDDITFSTNLAEFPEEIGIPCNNAQGWTAGEELLARVKDSGFELNKNKTRMSQPISRQSVTGLVVNEFPNTPREFRRNCRAAIHSALQGKKFVTEPFTKPLMDNCSDPKEEIVVKSDINRLESRLAHIHSISVKSEKFNRKKQMNNPTGTFRDYSDSILFRQLCREPLPFIVTEGPSDSLYLKGAILSLSAQFPTMSALDSNGVRHLAVRFPKSGSTSSKLVGLASGNGDLNTFLSRTIEFYRRLSNNVNRRRVVILVDNDDGLDHIKKTLKNVYNLSVAKSDNSPYFLLDNNFYLVKTPTKGSKTSTAIEDFIPQSLMTDQATGKTFSPDSKYDTSKHFGKVELGKKLYLARDSVNLSSISPVIARLLSAINA